MQNSPHNIVVSKLKYITGSSQSIGQHCLDHWAGLILGLLSQRESCLCTICAIVALLSMWSIHLFRLTFLSYGNHGNDHPAHYGQVSGVCPVTGLTCKLFHVIDHLMVFAIFLLKNSICLSIPVIHSPQHFSSFLRTFVSQSGAQVLNYSHFLIPLAMFTFDCK
jgi:hypothetical protein